MYELIILSLLMRGPVNGYVIAGVINDVIGPFARASNGRIYPLLSKLEEDGFISVEEESTSDGGRVARSFAITAQGRVRFRQLMLDTTSSPREYRALFAFKVSAFDQLEPADRALLLVHYLEFAKAHVSHLERQGRDVQENATRYGYSPAQAERMASVFEHMIESWRQEAVWAEKIQIGEARPAQRVRLRQRRPAKRS